uniref:DUF4806 domain-containing protein n=1 Tax=Anopheles coluzzii TaxID=1518534 RepID=A0A8W7PJP6_ANOCL
MSNFIDTVLKKLDGIELTIHEVRQEQKAQREKLESLEAAVKEMQPSLKKHGGMLQVLKDSATTAEVFLGQIRATICAEPPTSTGTVPEGFCVEAMSTGEQVIEFEKKLADNEYFKHVVDWLRYHITSANSTTRMTEALKAIFKPEAIAAGGWKGAKGKVALKDVVKLPTV